MTNIALLYLNGRGVERDEAEAGSWFTKAAALGDEAAQSNIVAHEGSATRGLFKPGGAGGRTARGVLFKPAGLCIEPTSKLFANDISPPCRLKKVLAGIALISACGFRTSAGERAEIGHSNSQRRIHARRAFGH